MSILEINDLEVKQKEAIYQTLVPDWLLAEAHDYHKQFRCPAGSRSVEITLKRAASDYDPMLYLNMVDTFNNQLLVLLAVVNDLDSPRFNIDVDDHGNPTHLGTSGRNIAAEKAAMAAGLAPGQIRRGLRVFRRLIPLFEAYVHNLQHTMFLIEPLAYHNAILFERYGFGYVKGQQEMERIHREFLPGGQLALALTPANAFRHPDAGNTVRGRSWAIHDGILGHLFTGFQMYKLLGTDLGINTFPDGQW